MLLRPLLLLLLLVLILLHLLLPPPPAPPAPPPPAPPPPAPPPPAPPPPTAASYRLDTAILYLQGRHFRGRGNPGEHVRLPRRQRAEPGGAPPYPAGQPPPIRQRDAGDVSRVSCVDAKKTAIRATINGGGIGFSVGGGRSCLDGKKTNLAPVDRRRWGGIFLRQRQQDDARATM